MWRWARSTTSRSSRSPIIDRKSTRLNSSHSQISYAAFCLKKKQRADAIVATLTTAGWTEGRELRALRGTASGLEMRADLTGDLNPDTLRAHIDGELIYWLRSVASGGAFTGNSDERSRRLLAAAQNYDLIDLEADRDLTEELLAAIPPHRRRIC